MLASELLAQWMPINASRHGHQVDNLINVIHVFMAVLFVGWGIFFVYCLTRFRARPGRRANPELISAKGSKYAEIGVAVFEAVLLLGFSMPAWAAYKNDFPDKEKALQVRVVAQQFAWNFHYPGPDGVFGKTDYKYNDETSNPIGLDPSDPAGKDDVVSINNLYVEKDRPVILLLSSKDVIHCFWVPAMRVKQDVVPGMAIPIWFEPVETGEYDITCAQLCGNNHFKMAGRCHVVDRKGFEDWMKRQKLTVEPIDAEEDFRE